VSCRSDFIVKITLGEPAKEAVEIAIEESEAGMY
jgi:hypothetical protein